MPHSVIRRPVLLRAAMVLATGLAALIPAAQAQATSRQVSILEEDTTLFVNPAGTLAQLQALGVEEVRVPLRWSLVAPNSGSRHEPKGFNAVDPNAKGYSWGIFDAIDRAAASAHITISFDVMGGAPMWAAKGPVPAGGSSSPGQPSASQYGLFVRAVGTRYAGSFRPTGDSTALPKVTNWSVWNEPNYGPSLSPQGLPGHLSIDYSPQQYRNLLDAAWSAFQRTGHGHDTIMFGELADRGRSSWGVNGGMTPGLFMRSLYCVGGNYRCLIGRASCFV